MTDSPRGPLTAFAMEADVVLEPGGDPQAIGAVLTTELCGSWQHEGACRWPHNTRVVRADGSAVRTRSVIAAPEADRAEILDRARRALRDPRLEPGVGTGATWRLVRADSAELEPDEQDLALRIGNVTPT